MPAQETLIKSCSFISNVSCYELAKDFSGPIVAILVAFFSVKFAFKQIAKQHENTLNAQKEEAKRVTRIELFKEINLLLEVSSSIIREVSTYCMVKKYSNIQMQADISHEEYLVLMNKFGQALLAIVSKVESHEIVNPMLFKVFRFSLQSIHYDLLAIQTEKNRSHVLENLIELANDAQSYLTDFQVCMQNIAYGEIFKSKIPHRVTVDKKYKVIVNEPEKLEKLLNYFSKETNWGRNCTKYENEALKKFYS